MADQWFLDFFLKYFGPLPAKKGFGNQARDGTGGSAMGAPNRTGMTFIPGLEQTKARRLGRCDFSESSPLGQQGKIMKGAHESRA